MGQLALLDVRILESFWSIVAGGSSSSSSSSKLNQSSLLCLLLATLLQHAKLACQKTIIYLVRGKFYKFRADQKGGMRICFSPPKREIENYGKLKCKNETK